jgi:hypothetical protein
VWMFFLLAIAVVPEVPHSKEPDDYNRHANPSLWASQFIKQGHRIG